MPTPVPPLTAPPDVPLRADRATFPLRAENWTLWEKNFHYTQLTAYGQAAFDNALDALAAALDSLSSANNSAASAAASLGSQNAASASAATALADRITVQQIYDQFDDRYLGPKSADPTLDNDGNSLADGAFYINTINGSLRAYTVANGWVQGVGAVAGVNSINGQQGAVELRGFIYFMGAN